MIKLPYGIADFRRIRQQGRVYIDRTAYIAEIRDLLERIAEERGLSSLHVVAGGR